MSLQLEIPAKARKEEGTGASRRLRHADLIPAVIYGGGKAPQSITIEHRLIIKAIGQEGFSSSVISLDVDGVKIPAVLKAVQRHVHKPLIMHADFQRISDTDKITIRVPFNFFGGETSPGVKLRSGIISTHMNDVEVKCFPNKLPSQIDVDLSFLDVDKSCHLSDITLPEGVEFATQITSSEQNLPVSAIVIPRGAASAKAAAAGDSSEESK
jgi:large subunit ribosomal protein L25